MVAALRLKRQELLQEVAKMQASDLPILPILCRRSTPRHLGFLSKEDIL